MSQYAKTLARTVLALIARGGDDLDTYEAIRSGLEPILGEDGAPQVRRVRFRTAPGAGTYEVVGLTALVSSAPVLAGARLMTFRSNTDGLLWARPLEDFNDLFEDVPNE